MVQSPVKPAMRPDLFAPVPEPAVQKVAMRTVRRDIGAAEFGGAMTAFDLAAQAMHHHLLAVADPQDRHAQLEDRGGRHRRAFGEDRGGPARKDHGFRGEIPQEGVVHALERVDFAIDVQLAQAAGDQLRHLAAEIDDQKAVMMGHGRGIGPKAVPRKARCGQAHAAAAWSLSFAR